MGVGKTITRESSRESRIERRTGEVSPFFGKDVHLIGSDS